MHQTIAMDKILLVVAIVASGSCALCASARLRFHVVYQPKTWNEALHDCKAKHHNLAAVHSKEDAKAMMDLGKMLKGEQLAWIGLYMRKWRWSSSEQPFKVDSDYNYWNPEELNKEQHTETCVLMDPKGYWRIDQCDQPHPSICMSNGSYKLMEQNQTWHQAQASCRSLNRELASVRNHTENYRVRRLIPGQQQAWLGLNRHSWKWSDGSNASFSLWQMGSPDNNSGNDSCVVANLNNSAQWEDHNCDSQHPFICYNVVHPVAKRLVKLTIVQKTSLVVLNHSAVLEQLQQRVQNSPASQHLKLSWKMREQWGKDCHQQKETNDSSGIN